MNFLFLRYSAADILNVARQAACPAPAPAGTPRPALITFVSPARLRELLTRHVLCLNDCFLLILYKMGLVTSLFFLRN